MSQDPQESALTPLGRRLVLVIGVNGQPAPGRAPLKYAVQDGQDIAQALQQSCCAFELFHPPLLGEQATTSQVRDVVLDLADQIQEDDCVLFFFSGHAEAILVEADLDDVYLVTHDFNAARLKRDPNAHLSLRWLRKVLFEHEKARSVLIILDCCYAGKFSDSAPDLYLNELQQRLKYYFGEPGAQSTSRSGYVRLALTATGTNAAKEQNGHGLLTGYLLTALKGECEQAINEQGIVTVTSLFDYLDAIMPPDQRPHFFGAGGRLILATYLDFIQGRREQRLRALFTDHSGFLQDRLESFVGREQEQMEVQQRIDTLLIMGGYLTITGQAGQGKSSIIVKLVETIKGQQGSYDVVAFHFIPLTPPPDYQVALLRNLMARLILKYDLSDLYLASESRAALCESFPRVLKEVAEKGGQEIIFIDGLDQLPTDQQTGLRDLSFLPQGPGNPPQGIVFVLGTRPDDTLRPLELLKPYNEYKLPDLSRADFDQILQHRGVTLGNNWADSFYDTLNKNALYLDLAAKELAACHDLTNQEVMDIIQQIADDPENLFSLTIDRLRQQKELWTTVVKPVLGLLLVTNEPLLRVHLKHLINLDTRTKVDGEQLNQGLERLGGLVIIDDRQRYSLFHLKFRDYLRQDIQRPKKKYVFDTEDEQSSHQRFIAWCEQGDPSLIWEESEASFIESGRRSYVREHYISHLYHADDRKKLFRVLDEGLYGKAKVKWDPSMRSYALDLDLGRKAATSPCSSLQEATYHLVRLWRYTLLRCSLASRADNYPKAAFEVMLLLQQETKALGLAELLTKQEYKSRIFTLIAKHLATLPGQEREAMQLFSRSEQIMLSISNEGKKAGALVELARVLGLAGYWQEAKRVIGSISNEGKKAGALVELARVLGLAGNWQEARQVISSIPSREKKADARAELARALSQAGNWQEAKQVISSIPSGEKKAGALTGLAVALSQAELWQEAKHYCQEAERVISSISNEEKKVNALVGLARALSDAGLWQEAEQVIDSISNEEKKVDALVVLAKALSKAELWQEAEQVVDSISNTYEGRKVNALAILVRELIRARLWKEAEQVIYCISEKDAKNQAMVELARGLRDTGLWQETERVIGSISREGDKSQALVKLAKALSKAELWQEAKQYWQEAERMIGSISNTYAGGKVNALARLAKVLSEAGHWQGAKQVIDSISNEEKKVDALVVLAKALSKAELWQETERVIGSISNEEKKSGAQVEMVWALSRAGYWQEAEQVMDSISNEEKKVDAQTGLAVALSQAELWQEAKHYWQEAERVISSISNEEKKVNALVGLARALSDAGLWQEAEQVIDSISNEEKKVDALVVLAKALSKAELWQEAEQVIDSISNTYEEKKVDAQTGLAVALSQAELWQEAMRHWQEAERVISSIFHERDKLDAQLVLARALSQARLWQEAEQVIDSISNAYKRNKVILLSEMAKELSKAGNWKDVERVIISIYDKGQKTQVLHSLVTHLTQHGQYSRVIGIIQREWLNSISRDDALNRFSLVFSLIPHYPDLGMQFYETFGWVDNFLQG